MPSTAPTSPALEDGDHDKSWITRRWEEAPGWACSMLLHAALLIILALITVTHQFREQLPEILAVLGEHNRVPVAEKLETAVPRIEVAAAKNIQETFEAPETQTAPLIPLPLDEVPRQPLLSATDEFASLESVPVIGSSELSGRTGADKAALIVREGGTLESEAAVALGLQWLANHQRRNGSWSFDHTTSKCRGNCTGPGALADCTTGATGLALLCFLGAGHSDQIGEYKDVVKRGVKYLVSQMKNAQYGDGDLMGRSAGRGRDHAGMYAQGIATLALCEAYNLGRSSHLRDPAQKAVEFIIRAQDTRGGGWRYTPGERGDTSVVGWQVMALYSGKIAELKVPQATLDAAWEFLDSVQSEEGIGYGYMRPGPRASLSAVGLLTRMYLGKSRGWDPDNPIVQRGAEYLSSLGPSRNDMYFNYYATQYMYQFGGSRWLNWNNIMRDALVANQDKNGHAAGSWRPTCPHGAGPGGRLYMTAMSILTLEVYYRHLPIYERSGDTPIDGGKKPIDF